jgi:hypothetical protein
MTPQPRAPLLPKTGIPLIRRLPAQDELSGSRESAALPDAVPLVEPLEPSPLLSAAISPPPSPARSRIRFRQFRRLPKGR